jgi:hypothetical protein
LEEAEKHKRLADGELVDLTAPAEDYRRSG